MYNRLSRKQKESAGPDFEQAAAQWQSLHEHEQAAEPKWELLKLGGQIDEPTLRMFDNEDSRLIAVTAAQSFLDRLKQTKAYARRAQPTRTQIDQYLKDARRRVVEEFPEW